MKILKIDFSDTQLILFAEGVNKAYKARNSDSIPYKPFELDELREIVNSEITVPNIYVMEDNGVFVGGVICLYAFSKEKNLKIAKISKVFSLPEYQKKGIASQLLEYAEENAKTDGMQIMQLDVANNYLPAVNLYRKMGYLPFSVYANEPNTYYFIRFIKSISPYKFSNFKRLISLIRSKMVFSLLFKKDSSPSWFGRYVYRKLKG